MSPKLFAVLLLLPAIYAHIHIRITASDDESETYVTTSGNSVDIISNTEKNTFHLDDNSLKNAVRSYFGQRPDDVFLRSSTPWGDLYKTYGWAQVSRTLTPQRVRILSNKHEPVIVLTQFFSNNSSKTAEFKAEIAQSVSNTVTSEWSKDGELTVGEDIEYGVDIEVVGVSGKTSLSYRSKWGDSASKSTTATIGFAAGIGISLQPNQSVVAELYATRGSMKVEVEYEASWSGTVAVNYNESYKGHHFWSLDVNAVMSAGGMKRSVRSSEVIDIGYYTNARVVMRDSQTNSVVYSIPINLS